MQLTEHLTTTTSPDLGLAPPRGRFNRSTRTETQLALPLLRLLDHLGAQDPSLNEHCDAVGHLAARIGRELGLEEAAINRLRLAGVLHDIGKVTIPQGIMQKTGALASDEWVEVRRHPETGYGLISGLGLDEIADWVLCHHERPDGRGYPFGLTSERIPLEASILSVADAFHAMTVERPYQSALSEADALEELRRCAGSQFDPAVVAAMMRLRDGAPAPSLVT